MNQETVMTGQTPPGKMRTALVLGSIALALFIGFIARVWIFGK